MATNSVTEILEQIHRGDPSASEQLLPLVYHQLRQAAAVQLSQEKPGQTLSPTALVHEAYVRLVDGSSSAVWDSRGHFYSAAAEAMRRILVEAARRRKSLKRGGALVRQNIEELDIPLGQPPDEILAVHEALEKLSQTDLRAAELIKLRYFAGFTMKEAAEILSIAPRTADDVWSYGRAWLAAEIGRQ